MIIEQQAETVEEAIEIALKKLGLPREKVKIEIISEGKKGVFGLGSRQAVIRASPLEGQQNQASDSAAPSRPSQENIEPILRFLEEVLKGIGLKATFRTSTLEDRTLSIDIFCSDTALLIGKKGKNIDALQHLVNVIAGSIFQGEERKILLDAEGYRSRRKQALITLAKKVAEEVRQTGKAVSLEPMNSFERRIIHVCLKDDPDITTESIGEGEERRVVIKLRRNGRTK